MDHSNSECCIHCKKCTQHCVFLNKYQIDLSDFEKRDELAYHCFLCGRCREVCPMDIGGREIALSLRRQKVAQDSKAYPEKMYKGLLSEKNPYLFRNYRQGKKKSVLFPGCNFSSFFPQTEKRLLAICRTHGVGLVRDCCSKPVYELGMRDAADKNISEMNERLCNNGVEEIIIVCPNCWHFLKGRLDVKMITIYDKLTQLGIGKKIAGNLPLYFPCPDRREKELFQSIKYFLEEEEKDSFPEVQCCGLGGCAAGKEPELSAEMARQIQDGEEAELYTYCASCISNFRRKGFGQAYHLLSLILEVDEDVPLGMKPFLGRAMKKFL